MTLFTPKRVKIFKTCNLYFCFFLLGLCVAIPGPTLIDLQHLVNTDISNIAFIYMARSVGYLSGSVTGGVLFDMINRKQLILTIATFLSSITMVAIPWSRQIKTLTVWMVANGLCIGVLDTGGNVCCLNLWGEDSAPFYQALHFMYGIGGLVAPLIAAPFLGDFSSLLDFDDNSTLFNNQTDFDIITFGNFQNVSSTYVPTMTYTYETLDNSFPNTSVVTSDGIPTVAYAYMIIGGYSFFVTFLFLVMCITSPIDESGKKAPISDSKGKNLLLVSALILLTSILIFTSMGTEVGYAQMLTTYATKGSLKLPTTTGSYMTSVYWASFTLSRLAAIFLAIKISNLTLIVIDVVLTAIGALILLFLAVKYEWALWLASIILGVGIASFFPSSVSWIEKYITVTNKVAATFAVGASFGEMVLPYLISYYIETLPEVFIYVVIGSSVVSAVTTLIMYLILRNRPDKYSVQEGVSNPAYTTDTNV